MSEEKKNIISEREIEIQNFWKDNKIFEKTLEATKNGPVYNFYDGPPFATGTTHYGHLVASVMKDAIPRYQTMKGNYVERKWGWDCHGLPIENIAEKALGFKSKKDIEEYGVENFNAFCRSKVLEYVDVWKKTIPRFGRWADMENPYKTMDLPYMESVWWVFKELYDKGLIYEGYKSMHVCPRCETTLSQMEVSEGYKDIKDLTSTWKFKIKGQENTYLLSWTTVPWSTLSTMGLAVGVDFDYVKVKFGDEFVIFIKGRLEKIMEGKGNYEIVEEFKGSKLVGLEYEHLVNFYKELPEVKNNKNVYHVFAGDYVEASEGTGIVTINGSYGEIDLQMTKKEGLPVVMDVMMNGHLAEIAKDYACMYVEKAEKQFIADMEKKGLVWNKEEYVHSYPHCWRCDTPLLNYSTSSWFVKVTDVKEKALKLAKDINWSPAHIKEGRFGKWLEGARDWSISRQRFWASVMPIWKCDCGHMEVLGSVAELDKLKITKNKIFGLRHGESEKNVNDIFDFSEKNKLELTKKGIGDVEKIVPAVKKLKIDLIISSNIFRAKQTAEIVAKNLGLEIIFDARLNETNYGDWQGKSEESKEAKEMQLKWRRDSYVPVGGEGLSEESARLQDLWKDINEKYEGKNILIVSHGDPLRVLKGILSGCQGYEIFEKFEMTNKAELVELNEMTFDLHKDYMDKVQLKCKKCKGKMTRIPDVLDTWFDSGSMPYAQNHYPFENKEKFDKSFPAEFIAEGVDQTRAWFYYLHVISSAIKGSRTFSNVIVNGIVLAEDGKKMAKKLKNYPEPEIVMEKYGADALRYYLLTSPVVSAENMNFSEAGVKEAMQKVIMLTNNILNFYKLYEPSSVIPSEAEGSLKESDSSATSVATDFGRNDKLKIETNNILDKWLLAKLNLLIQEVTKQMDAYDLPRSVRPTQEFIDEFSTWWLRRSRDRFKSENEKDKNEALIVFKFTLTQLSKLMAPFVPFIAEYLYKEVCAEKESVHLESWPEALKLKDEKVISQMDEARKVVEMGLASRAEKGIKIRQPLSKLTVYGFNLSDEFAKIIADEVNVKEVVFEKGEPKAELDTEITEELKQEGMVREIIRTINDLRKKQGLSLEDNISVEWQSDSEVLNSIFSNEKYILELKKNTITEEFVKIDLDSPDININGESIRFEIKRR